jgi:hypothetical protein
MEITLAVLIVLGIFVGIPVLIGLTIAGMYTLKVNKVRKTESARTVEAVIKARTEIN